MQAKIEAALANKAKREGFIAEQEAAEQTDAVLGSRVELASIDAELESMKVEEKILDIEIEALKTALSTSDTTGFKKGVKDAISATAL